MNNKFVCITGSAKGIGAKTAEFFARDGYNIILHYNTSNLLAREVKEKLEKEYFAKVFIVQADLSKETDINKLASFIKQCTDHLDVLINNASLSLDCDIYSKTKEDFIRVLDVNLIAPFLITRKLSNILDNGVVVNISSTDGINTGNMYNIDYSASKAGLNCITKILSDVFRNIRIYALAPNWVQTESVLEMESQFLKDELKRIGQKNLILPEEVAQRILNIVNAKNLLSGSIIRMDGNNE